nr:MAG TPA: Folliculin-interacting protein middle domain [Caudoviricetes sp.]DAX82739.1 MAG TPA: Folliculin-interacting protein middle domain [Caudoviricetes sp.]
MTSLFNITLLYLTQYTISYFFRCSQLCKINHAN